MAALIRNTNNSIKSNHDFLASLTDSLRYSFALEGIELSEREMKDIVNQQAISLGILKK
jgi:hypothetical protein